MKLYFSFFITTAIAIACCVLFSCSFCHASSFITSSKTTPPFDPTLVNDAVVEDSHGLPCLLNNGCWCDHNKPHYDPASNQWYGTCIYCFTKGWAGWNCLSEQDPCFNTGYKEGTDADSKCHCVGNYEGDRCQELMCANAKNSSSSSSPAPPQQNVIAPVNPETNSCEGVCLEGWGGVGCNQCQTDDACIAKAKASSSSSSSAADQVCWRDLASVGTEIHLQCNIAGNVRQNMIVSNNSNGKNNSVLDSTLVFGNFHCKTDVTWRNIGAPGFGPFGSCAFNVYRRAIRGDSSSENNIIKQDSFMHCKMDQCWQNVVVMTSEPAFGPPSGFSVVLRSVFTYITLAICGVLTLVVVFSPPKRTAKIGPWLVLAIAILIFITVILAVFVGLSNRTLISPQNRTEEVEYFCQITACSCDTLNSSESPKLANRTSCDDFRIESLPVKALNGKSDFRCNRYNNSCKLFSESLADPIILESCDNAVCVENSMIPAYDKNTPSPNSEDNNRDDSGNKELFGDDDHDDLSGTITVWAAVGVVSCGTIFCVIHLFWYFKIAVPRMKVHWIQRVGRNAIAEASDQNQEEKDDFVVDEATRNLLSPKEQQEHQEQDGARPDEVVLKISDEDFEKQNETVLKLRGGTFDIPQAIVSKIYASCRRSASTKMMKKTRRSPTQQTYQHHHQEGEEHVKKHQESELDVNKNNNDDDDTEKETRIRVLHDIDFQVKSGQSLALLGGSGSGKTTTLNLLAALKVDGSVGGQLSINDDFFLNLSEINSTASIAVATYRSMIGFVHQDDRLIEYLTVRQCIFHAARMRLPLPLTDEQITELVDEVINELGLTTCQDTQVGGGAHVRGVSGGERRRVSIACELVGYPRILLLDEPTSGLDALSARKVMQLVLRLPHRPLKTLQKYGGNYFNFKPIVIFSIHQPSADIYQMFDQVMVLVSGRKVVFDSARFALEEGLQKCGMTVGEVIESMMMTTEGDAQNKNKNEPINNNTKLEQNYGSTSSLLQASSPTTTGANNNKKSSPKSFDKSTGSITEIEEQEQDDNDENEASISSLTYQQKQLEERSNVNPAELLLQVALKLHEIMMMKDDDDVEEPTNQQQQQHDIPTEKEETKHQKNHLLGGENEEQVQNKRSTSSAYSTNTKQSTNGNSTANLINASTKLSRHEQPSAAAANPQSTHEQEQSSASKTLKQQREKADDDDADDDETRKNSNRNHSQYRFIDQEKSPKHTYHSSMKATGSLAKIVTSLDEFKPGFWHQLLFLFHRSLDSFTGMFTLTAAHVFSAMFLSFFFMLLYQSEGLDLSGVQDKAGMVTFLLLVIAFSSISCLGLLVSEGRVFASDYDRGLYGVVPYFLVKIFFDFIPYRILPTAILGVSIYFPLGLRTDGGGVHFIMFVVILLIFSIWNVALCLSIGLIFGSFGTSALICSLAILWNMAFGGLLVQTSSMPKLFRPFKYVSPHFFSYESIMVNELIGRECLFNPVSNAETPGGGRSHGAKRQVPCTDFLLTFGLSPNAFLRDLTALIAGTIAWLIITVFLMKIVAVFRKNQ